jgi:lipopolysaccharide transport system ATP-binding protein
MLSEPIIAARGLGKAYPIYRRPEDRLKQLIWGRRHRFYEEFWALRNVDLNVRRGETVGIIGHNGSGKSTLLQLVCGTLRPSSGEVRARGRVAAMLELGSGFNPQFTGRENIRLGASVLGLGAAEIEDRFDSITAFADIGQFIDQPLKHYSSGMHARLAFAVCANVDADVLVVDEILSVGDAAFQQKCMRFLNRFRLHGTLLFVSHDNGAIVKLCDRVLWLDRGEVREFGEAKEICRLYLAAQAEEAAEEREKFRLGGRRGTFQFTQPVAESNTAPKEHVREESADADALIFDPDDEPRVEGEAEIISVGFYSSEGARIQIAAGGEPVDLRIVCRPHRTINLPVVAFVVRDRLGQALFSDDSSSNRVDAPQVITPGKFFSASFSFFLPYLGNGAYAVEAFLFMGHPPGGHELIQKFQDKSFLYVQSTHPSNGLANVAMRAVTFAVELEQTNPRDVCSPADAIAAGTQS